MATTRSRFDGKPVENLTGEDSRQTISIWDAICEGPIEGLVDGNASVFLDNDPIVEAGDIDHVTNAPSYGASITLTNGSKNATVASSATLSSAVGRVLVIDRAKLLTGLSGTIKSTTITIAGGAPDEIDDTIPGNPFVSNIITVDESSPSGGAMKFRVRSRDSSTSISVARPLYNSFSGKSGSMSYQVKVASVSGSSTLVLTENWPFDTGTYQLTQGTDTIINPTSVSEYRKSHGNTKKVGRSTVQFRTGSGFNQEPIKEIGALQGNSISKTTGLNRVLELHSDYFQYYPEDSTTKKLSFHTETQGSDSTYILDSVSDLGLLNSNEVDEIILSFQYQTLTSNNWANGQRLDAYSAFLVDFSYSRDGGSTYTDVTLPVIEHRYQALQGFAVDEAINLEPFQPFDRWKVKIKRITASSGASYDLGSWVGKPLSQYDADGKRNPDSVLTHWRISAACKLATITSIIKNKLSYPYTAYAAITFDSKSFPSMPDRSYLIRGKKVKVPSNYVTREESSTGIASYTRDSNGDIQSSYQDWDGSFREEVYTNNPAWVLYDLINSKRYGLGRFVSDVDKWSFFRVGKYCDELVPDGKGGQEPRYTCNLALQKEAPARKTVRDLATNFLGLLHWLNGEMYLTADQPSSPVYTFGRGNVHEGKFSYSSTEFKQRPNQYVVLWNNPELDYQQDFVLVEDTENIVESGIVLSKQTVAFGCTSRSQAERYGRWRLFTDRLQTRSVSFLTSVNAAMINPGDIIAVQDAGLDKVELSGRISNTGTVNATTVALDRNVTLEPDYTYTLNVLFFSPAAILVDDSATVNSVPYVKGDVILTTNNGSALTEENVNNLTDEADSNRPLNVNWKPDTHVQSKVVSTSPGTVDSLSVPSFSTAPTRGSMWTLTARNNNIVQSASSKDYLVVSVKQQDYLVWNITAVEHFNSKFGSVESNFNLVVEDEDFKGPSSTDIIPTVSNLLLAFSNE